MSEETPEQTEGPRPGYVIVGPDGHAVPEEATDGTDDGADEARGLTDLVEQPAKVMRIGSMIRQLLEEVKAAPLDEAGRKRLAGVLHTSLDELKDGLAPELDDELGRLVQPFDSGTPTESELRIAQAQLVGWLEGLFHGIQTAIYAQQMAARAQLEQMRRALPAGALHQVPGMGPGAQAGPEDEGHTGPSGMYL
ncbi:MAG TPA: bacterial proteasome activator family protein [Marmoricola sp.]